MKKSAWMLLPIAVAIGGCLSSSDNSPPATGTLKLGITDAPVSGAKNVFVQFSGVELHGPDGTVMQTFALPRKIDLLAFSGSNATPLFEGTLTAGNYQWLRLLVDTSGLEDTYLVDANDSKHELSIPSSAQTGLKLVSGFTVAAGGSSAFTIDFDLRKSLVQDSSGYQLKPALRLIDNLQAGTLAGIIAAPGCAVDSSATVYVFSGSNATPNDITGTTTDPIATARVNSLTGAYEVGFLPIGSYTVTFTCSAAGDDPEIDDAITFTSGQNANIAANITTTLNF